MKKSLLFAALALTSAFASADLWTINFDTDSNWTGSGSLTSYNSGHVYAESDWSFTGGPALRQNTTVQDGVAGALGTYAWRLRDAAVTWTATYTAALDPNEYFTSFGLDARRWDGSPSPAYTVEYSMNGGSSFATATSIGTNGIIDNAGLGNTSNWATFSQNVTSPTGLAANQFVVRLTATSGERIMVDNFTAASAIPEPSMVALLLVGFGIVFRFIRRK
jgi:hypothetical protein